MTHSLLARQLPVDEWIMLPTPEIPGSRNSIAMRKAHTRHIRHILFDLGAGLFTNLSPELHQIVLDACRSDYNRYVEKAKREGRTPMRFQSGGRGYISFWKWMMKGIYVRNDIPRKLKEYQKVA